MVFVHVSRCLIFKVHWPCSLFVISVVSSVSLNRGDYYILAHLKAFVKNFFAILQSFSQLLPERIAAFPGALEYTTTAFPICQPFFANIPYYFLFCFFHSRTSSQIAKTRHTSRVIAPIAGPANRPTQPPDKNASPRKTIKSAKVLA